VLGSSIALARTVLSALAVTGLVVVFGDVGEAAADIAVGPGPTDYTAQQSLRREPAITARPPTGRSCLTRIAPLVRSARRSPKTRSIPRSNITALPTS